jgi:hypothetical protein
MQNVIIQIKTYFLDRQRYPTTNKKSLLRYTPPLVKKSPQRYAPSIAKKFVCLSRIQILKKTGHLSQKPKKLVRSSLPKIGGFDFDFSKFCGILEKICKNRPERWISWKWTTQILLLATCKIHRSLKGANKWKNRKNQHYPSPNPKYFP